MLAVFEKGERIRHIGHLDIQRSVQRGLRRSGLPVAYSQGFNPHILVTFASALSTGACGKREIMDVTMAEDVDSDEFLNRMNKAMPPEMQLKEARSVDNKYPSLPGMVRAADYDLTIRDADIGKKLTEAISAMMAKDRIPAMRKTKTKLTEVDIKPLILRISARDNHIYTTLILNEHESCKPQMLLEALKEQAGISEEVRMLVIRESLLGENEQGVLTPLERL